MPHRGYSTGAEAEGSRAMHVPRMREGGIPPVRARSGWVNREVLRWLRGYYSIGEGICQAGVFFREKRCICYRIVTVFFFFLLTNKLGADDKMKMTIFT